MPPASRSHSSCSNCFENSPESSSFPLLCVFGERFRACCLRISRCSLNPGPFTIVVPACTSISYPKIGNRILFRVESTCSHNIWRLQTCWLLRTCLLCYFLSVQKIVCMCTFALRFSSSSLIMTGALVAGGWWMPGPLVWKVISLVLMDGQRPSEGLKLYNMRLLFLTAAWVCWSSTHHQDTRYSSGVHNRRFIHSYIHMYWILVERRTRSPIQNNPDWVRVDCLQVPLIPTQFRACTLSHPPTRTTLECLGQTPLCEKFF